MQLLLFKFNKNYRQGKVIKYIILLLQFLITHPCSHYCIWFRCPSAWLRILAILKVQQLHIEFVEQFYYQRQYSKCGHLIPACRRMRQMVLPATNSGILKNEREQCRIGKFRISSQRRNKVWLRVRGREEGRERGANRSKYCRFKREQRVQWL